MPRYAWFSALVKANTAKFNPGHPISFIYIHEDGYEVETTTEGPLPHYFTPKEIDPDVKYIGKVTKFVRCVYA